MDIFPVVDRLAWGALRASGVRSHRVPTALGRLHVYDAPGRGDLPPVVLFHGIGSSAAGYARVLSALRRESVRVLAPEAPGHGLSDGPSSDLSPATLFGALSEAVLQLAPGPFVVVGNSLGGGVALRFALTHPERVRALVVVSPAGAPMAEDALGVFLERFALATTAEARDFLARLYHRPPSLAPLLAPGLRHAMKRPAVRSLLGSVSPEDFFDPEALRALPMPILLLWGRSDRIMPPEHLAFFRDALPAHARIEEPPDVGHSPQLERPRALASRIASFAREALAAPTP